MAAVQTSALLRHIRRLSKSAVALIDRQLLAGFIAEGDEAAFAELVGRHGAMVLDVCRRTLQCEQDAEDAFQATFLVLARKAASIRKTESLASWLYGVAWRCAARLRADLAARRRHEGEVMASSSEEPPDPSWRDVQEALHEELARLPEKYRAPLVLCYLEGQTQREAARQLGCGQGVLHGRLDRGRERLRQRMLRRGIALSAALLAGHVASKTPVSAALIQSTTRLTRGLASAPVAALANVICHGLLVARLKVAAFVLLATAVVLALGYHVVPVSEPLPENTEQGELKVENRPPKAAPNGDPLPTGVVSRIVMRRFRASQPVGDARYSPDGKLIVGFAGSTIYVWDAGDGSVVRKINTNLEPLDDPTNRDEKTLAFAANPKIPQVACGGVRDGNTILQIWNYETGRPLAEKPSSCDALKALAWTPDGNKLLERTNVGWWQATGWKLIVRDVQLDVVRSHDLPKDFGEWGTLMCPAPGSPEVILWQSGREPIVLDLDSGKIIRTIAYKPPGFPAGLALSPDGRTLAATGTESIVLIDFAKGKTEAKLPILREGWEKPRPLFAPNGKTVYVWDHQPVAYEVATGREKWRGYFRTQHSLSMRLCDISPDGATLLVRHGNTLSRLDSKTGAESDPPDGPATPAGLLWSPDGRMLFTRTERLDRTWTAWESSSGKRLYDLRPTGFVADEEWKMLPDLFFMREGKEIVAGLEKAEKNEQSGAKELLVFDAATGRCLRRLGDPLSVDTFRWMHPIAIDGDGKSVLMQKFAIGAEDGPGPDIRYAAFWWDPVNKAQAHNWTALGNRVTPPRHFAPYVATIRLNYFNLNAPERRTEPALIRCYALADGRLIHELQTDLQHLKLDRIEGNLLLSEGYNGKYIARGNLSRYTRTTPVAYDLWELSSREKVRIFESEQEASAVLGPGGRFIIRVTGETGIEIYEPFVLKRAIAKVATPCRAEQVEFSADGRKCAASLSDASILIMDAMPWRAKVQEQIAREVPADLAPLWEDLAKDSAIGLRAARLLSAKGDQAVSLLDAKIPAKVSLPAADVKKQIADLDAPVFADREKAEKALREMSTRAELHLREALRGDPSPEMKRRIEKLLKAIEVRRLTSAEHRELRAVQALQWMDTDAARALLAKWSKGDATATLTLAAKQASGR